VANQIEKKDFNLLQSEVQDKQSKIVVTDNLAQLDNMSEFQIAIVRNYDADNNPSDEMGMYVKFDGQKYKVNLTKVD
jgi:hypothetical protein